MYSHVAESFNSWILAERALPITSCLDSIRIKLMEQMCKRREEVQNWKSVLCPTMEARLSELINEGHGWDVFKSSDYTFEVKSSTSHHVDLNLRMCSCNQWKITCFPCAHAIKCMNRCKLSVYEFVEYYYTTEAYRASYSHAIMPIPNFDKPKASLEDSEIVRPPKSIRQAGRPSFKRKGGPAVFKTKENKCGRCSQYGHNRRNCKSVLKF